MASIQERKKLRNLISSIRNSHPDITKLYMEGQCFNFACILRSQFEGGVFWYSYLEGHMYYKYGDYWYDIRGEHLTQPVGSTKYSFKDGDPAYRWGRRDKRFLIEQYIYDKELKMEAIKSRIRKTIQDHLHITDEEMHKHEKENHCLFQMGADSLDIVEIAMEIEEDFEVEIQDEDLNGNTKLSAIFLEVYNAVN